MPAPPPGRGRGDTTTRRALLVTGGAAPHVLAAARSLSRAGWEVGLAVAEGDAYPTRAVVRAHRVPAPERSPDGFVAAVAALVGQHGYQVVLGADDIEVLLLSARRDEIPAVVPHPDHAAVLGALDKLALTGAAARAGLGVPRTEPATTARLDAVDGPVVVKSRLHWDPTMAGDGRHLLAAVCADRAAARRAADVMTAAGGEALLQEVVEGELMALTVVRDRDGRLLGVVQQRSPGLSDRGTSCRAVTVPVDTTLLAGVERLLDGLGWWGLANVQLLRPPGGRPLLIDVNPRIYGSLALAVAAGVPLPDLWCRAALGEHVVPASPARVGVRFQSLLADLARARRERRGGLVRDVASCVAWLPAAHPHAHWRDPAPAVRVLRERLARRAAAPGERR